MSREQIACSRVESIGVGNKNAVVLQCENDLKHNKASFSTISTDLLCLRVAQMPTSPDLAISC